MSSVLHQIFYNYNKFDNEASLIQLNEYFLTNTKKKGIIDAFEGKSEKKVENIQEKELKTNNENIFFPNKQNPLFWCIYIAINGYEKYMYIANKYGNVELEEKQKIIEYLKTGYSKLKEINKKITKTIIQEWMSELMSSIKISIPLLQLFSVYYKKNIILYNEINNTYLRFLAENDTVENLEKEIPIVIIKTKDNNYGLYSEITIEKLNELTKGICLEDNEKPMKGISNYKMTELTELAKRCNISIEGVNKPELYGKIWNYLQIAKV